MSATVVKSTPANELDAAEIPRRIAAGHTTAEAVVRDCLARIEAREDTVRAWAFLDPELALQQARALDRGPARGPLHGIPVGIKDVIDTFDMPTQMGSAIYDGYRPQGDAACVAQLRAAGAVILGKTVTCEFAGMEPNKTRNPRNPGHTPGGSSSGSAAAVADFMVPVAFGTQTGGSILRPSSFCGAVGYKPGYGTISRTGLKFAAESLDTIGPIARSVEDVALVTDVLAGRAPKAPSWSGAPPRVGLCRTPFWDTAAAETVAAIEDSVKRLAAAGATIRDVATPAEFDGLGAARDLFNEYERARAHAHDYRVARDRLSVRLRETIERGMAVPWERYAEAQRLAQACRARLGELFAGCDVLLAPCVVGEAPRGLAQTGDPKMQGFWTILHTPTITLPTHKGPNDMPVGIQLVGPAMGDRLLLDAACWVWDRLGPQR